MDRREAERRAAQRSGDQAEAEGKRPSGHPGPELDRSFWTRGAQARYKLRAILMANRRRGGKGLGRKEEEGRKADGVL